MNEHQRILIILLVVLTLLLTLAFGFHQVRTDDGFWHLRAGQYQLEHRQVLTRDVFSATREGSFWFNNAWIYQVLLAAVYGAGGWIGVQVMDALMALATVVLILWACLVRVKCPQSACRAKPTSTPVPPVPPLPAAFPAVIIPQLFFPLFWLGLLLMTPRFFTRPDLLSMVCAAAFMLVLTLHRVRGRGVFLWWLIPVMLIWANSHTMYFFGLLAVAGFWLDAAVDAFASPPGDDDPVAVRAAPGRTPASPTRVRITHRVKILIRPGPFRRLTVLFIALVGCVLISPYGLQNLLILGTYTRSGPIIASLTEWIPTLTWTTWLDFNTFPWLKLYLLLLLVGMVVGRRRLGIGDVFLVLAAVLLAGRYARSMAMLAILTLPTLEALWHGFRSAAERVADEHPPASGISTPAGSPPVFPASRRTSFLQAAGWIPLLLVLAICIRQWSATVGEGMLGLGLYPPGVPAAACSFIEKTGIEGPVFNSYNYGGYMIFRLWPRVRVFIDGRTATLYDNDDFLFHRQALIEPAVFEQARKKAPFDLIFEENQRILPWLENSSQWFTVYLDGHGRMLARRGSATGERLSRYRLDFLDPRTGSVRPGVSPEDRAALGQSLDTLLGLTPGNGFLHLARSRLLEEQGDLDAALAEARLALECDQWDDRHLARMGDLLMKTGHPLPAADFYRRLLTRDAKNLDAWNNLAAAYEGARKPTRALRAARRAMRLAGDDLPVTALDRQARLTYQLEGNRKEAIDLYRRAVILAPDESTRHPLQYNLAQLLVEGGEWSAAYEVFKALLVPALSPSAPPSAVRPAVRSEVWEPGRDPRILFQAAAAAAKCGDEKQARTWQDAAHALAPSIPSVPPTP